MEEGPPLKDRSDVRRPRHSLAAHTSEVELRIEAPDLTTLFEEAARALAELMAEDARGSETVDVRVHVEAPSREELLVRWIDEIVFLTEVHTRVYGDVRVEHADDQRLVATLAGHVPEIPRTAVKAATWHRLAVRDHAERDGWLEARVVLDV